MIMVTYRDLLSMLCNLKVIRNIIENSGFKWNLLAIVGLSGPGGVGQS